MTKEIRVLIADDHPLFRHGLVAMIESDEEIKVISEAENGKIAIELAEQKKPDVIILDVDMPVIDGVETAQTLRNKSLDAKIIFLTMHKDKSLLKSLKKLQVNGYVVKDSAVNEIITCIKKVFAGKTFLSPKLNNLILENFEEDSADYETLPIISSLTPSEKRVLSLITESKTNHEIADELFISVRTVESHRYNISTKLNLHGSHALLKFAIRNRDKILTLTENK